MRNFDVLVDAKLPSVMFDVKDSCEFCLDNRIFRANGEIATFESGTNKP
jgi:hypothetical protein